MIANLPNELLVLGCILIGLSITLITFYLTKKLGIVVEVILLLLTMTYIFIAVPFLEGLMLVSYTVLSYSTFSMKINRAQRAKRIELKKKLQQAVFIEIVQSKNNNRIVADLLLTGFVIIGTVLFYLFAPETYATLKFIIVVMTISVLGQMVDRLGNFYGTKVYWLREEERVIIISSLQSREFPLTDLKEITKESAPDLLKLHPLFTILSANQDYTTSFQSVLKLSFTGENVYLTPEKPEQWFDIFKVYIPEQTENEVMKVLPLWHPKVLKRLFWKGYFAITVKGVSAYTGLLLVLLWLEVPKMVMVGAIICWWLLNLYVSDRVLITATDAKEITEGEIFERAQLIFRKAKIPNVKLFLVDSPIHNGLAIGMNIGKGSVLLTKATTQLSIESVESIIAHEAIHIQKRDVLMNQVARLAFMGTMAGMVYLFYDQIITYTDNLWIVFPFIYCLMLAFPMYLSFVAQWAEVRADHLGAELVAGGRTQMKNGLCELGNALDHTLEKNIEYSAVEKEASAKSEIKNVERNGWLMRLIEFHFLDHPPLYWRIHMLTVPLTWGKAWRKWMVGRLVESLPDFRKGAAKS